MPRAVGRGPVLTFNGNAICYGAGNAFGIGNSTAAAAATLRSEGEDSMTPSMSMAG
jgi:hypothetical protein